MFEAFVNSMVGIVAYQVIGVALFLPLELAFPKARMSFADRTRGFLFLLAAAPIAAAFGVGLTALKQVAGIQPFDIHGGFGAPLIASIVLALWVDLQFYALHRIEHRFFWRFHAVHHSVRNLSAANSFHHWTEPLWAAVTIGIPLMFVDVQIAPTLGLLSVIFRFQQFYIHSGTRLGLGPLSKVLVDNRYHRIHHSVEPKHWDKNFGAMTPLWDWLFGTMWVPEKDEWPETGLVGIDEPDSLAEWSSLPWRYGSVRAGAVKEVPLG